MSIFRIMRDFQSDLKQGKKYEEISINFFKSKYQDYNLKYPEGYFKEYDFCLYNNENDIKVEVKADFHKNQLIEDPNLVIECICNEKESGINSTKAKFITYFFTLKNLMILISVKNLKTYIKENNLKIINYKNSDYSKASGYLIKLSQLKENKIAMIYPF